MLKSSTSFFFFYIVRMSFISFVEQQSTSWKKKRITMLKQAYCDNFHVVYFFSLQALFIFSATLMLRLHINSCHSLCWIIFLFISVETFIEHDVLFEFMKCSLTIHILYERNKKKNKKKCMCVCASWKKTAKKKKINIYKICTCSSEIDDIMYITRV